MLGGKGWSGILNLLTFNSWQYFLISSMPSLLGLSSSDDEDGEEVEG